MENVLSPVSKKDMMTAYRTGSLSIAVDKKGRSRFKQASYPVRYGRYSEIRTDDHEFHFNLKGEIRFIRGTGRSWPHPSEWLKRSDGNDWSYYSVGASTSFKRISALTGEYYLTFPAYTTNSIVEFNMYSNPGIADALAAWSKTYADICCINQDDLPPRVREFVRLVTENNEDRLFMESERLHSIIGGGISVMPPDSRHVDYEVIPVNIADGCLYNCRFCCVKSGMRLKARSWENIHDQITQMKDFQGKNLQNYNAVFLGNHDGLGAGTELICKTAEESFRSFGFSHKETERPLLFLFGSAGTFLGADGSMFEMIDALPFRTYINIGLESADSETLAFINKPLTPARVREALVRMIETNRKSSNIEVSANFLLGENLPSGHKPSLMELLGGISDRQVEKGTVYLSPLKDSLKKNELMQSFFDVKRVSRLNTFIYLIQRL